MAALLGAGLVDAEVIARRLAKVPKQHLPATERALAWLAALHGYEQLAASRNDGDREHERIMRRRGRDR